MSNKAEKLFEYLTKTEDKIKSINIDGHHQTDMYKLRTAIRDYTHQFGNYPKFDFVRVHKWVEITEVIN